MYSKHIPDLQYVFNFFTVVRPCDADKLVDRQTSAPTGYVSSTSPIVIKRLHIKKEAASPAPAPAPAKERVETATATATIQIQPPATARPARIKINVVRTHGEGKENVDQDTSNSTTDTKTKIHPDNQVTLTLPLKT